MVRYVHEQASCLTYAMAWYFERKPVGYFVIIREIQQFIPDNVTNCKSCLKNPKVFLKACRYKEYIVTLKKVGVVYGKCG